MIKNISIIIPNLNDAQSLEKCLVALENQSFGRRNIEVIVVDNGSSDQSIQIAKRFADKVLHTSTSGNPYVARNLGIQKASHQYLGLLDAKCVPNSSLVELITDHYQNSDHHLITGNIVFDLDEKSTIGEYVDAMVFVSVREVISAKEGLPGGAFFFFEKPLIEKVGWFREDMRSGADGEWTTRIWKKGLSIGFVPEAKLYYKGRNMHALIKKARRTGKGHKQFAQLSPEYSSLSWHLDAIRRMRPASIKYINYCIAERLNMNQVPYSKFFLSVSIWIYRIFHSIGRLGI